MRPKRWLWARLSRAGGESGLTLIELLVAATMSVVIVGAAGSMLISAVRTQPKVSERAQNVSTARYVLERMTRELRNSFYVYPEASASSVSLKTRVRRTECGGAVEEEPDEPAIACRVTYSCSGAPVACTRAETDLESSGGTPVTIVSGLESPEVFSYAPDAEEPTYVGVTLQIPNPESNSNLTISDGAGLRTLALAN